MLRAVSAVTGSPPSKFIEFYTAHRDHCLRAVTASTGDPRLAEELVAEGFARAWASWRTVSRHPAPHAWVVRVALNVHVSRWRRRRREVALDGQDPATPEAQDPVVDPVLLAALRRLPRRQREVVALRILLDLDTATTAETLGITAGTVTTHLSRAMSALREDFSRTKIKEDQL